jgi:hypothetical protein
LAVLFLGIVAGMASAATLTIRPDGQGFYSAWTNVGCSSGSSEWQCVDESSANTSDYLKATNTAKESFSFGSTGLSTETVNSVTIYYYAKWNLKTADSCFDAMIRASSTDYAGNNFCTNGTWLYYSQTYSTNPATGSAWTIAEVNALEAGMKGGATNGGGYVAQVYAVVDYNPLLSDLFINGLNFYEYDNSNGTGQVRAFVWGYTKNAGVANASASTTQMSYLSTDDQSVGVLAPGVQSYFSRDYLCTSAHTFTATADFYGAVTESNEGNNAASVYIDCVV